MLLVRQFGVIFRLPTLTYILIFDFDYALGGVYSYLNERGHSYGPSQLMLPLLLIFMILHSVHTHYEYSI